MDCDPVCLPCWDVLRQRLEDRLAGEMSACIYFRDEMPFALFLSVARPSDHAFKVKIRSYASDPISDIGCLQVVSRIFPRAENLKCYQLSIEDQSLLGLLSSKCISKLMCCGCHSIIRLDVSMMASRLPSLKCVKFEACSDFDTAAAQSPYLQLFD